ncbi:MAG: hypothetical protein AVDCRST_MAG75-2971, partial [uncultured Propionibacteriaceae bacterium]
DGASGSRRYRCAPACRSTGQRLRTADDEPGRCCRQSHV